ncbi:MULTISPECIES: hypothetical protein [Catenuloplanes]|uniref:Uncharacterized protein n=1 Tax=Catenuloplanes niger TaxID=587534 RepID=A0AAE4CY91_9ACTN|nr:hypothetical protein [Catenuloplanes niger]MDR7327328.1 hypothetical protein [Catenuloplanes niger]
MTGVDLVIDRCTVRVVRRGGWSWGPDPRALPARVLDALPELLLAHLPAHVTAAAEAGHDVEITEPVTLDVTITLADLLAGLAEPTPAAPEPTPGGPAGHHRTAPAPDGEPAHRDGAARAPAGLTAEDPENPEGPPRVRANALATAVAALRDGGVLDRLAPDQLAALGLPPGDGGTAPGTAVAASVPPARRQRSEVEVDSALPFLAAAAYARIGLLDAIFDAVPGGDAPLLAAALAYQVLSPPRRGWLRADADRVAAAAFAGLAEPPPEDALTALAHRTRPVLPALAATVGLTVCAGHPPGRPLLVTRPERGGVLLAEADGLFPVAWAADVPALVPFWHAAGRPTVLATPGTDAPELDGRRPPRTAEVVDLIGRLGELTDALGARTAVPLAVDDAFARALMVTAGVGLGTIAWLLWRHREPTDPQLALDRLGDLSARVRFTAEEVRVRLPLGRRHADLAAHGLLTDVRHAVWLGGRTLTFDGG